MAGEPLYFISDTPLIDEIPFPSIIETVGPISSDEGLGWLSDFIPQVDSLEQAVELLIENLFASPVSPIALDYPLFPYVDHSIIPEDITSVPFDYLTTQGIVELAALPRDPSLPHVPAEHTCELTLLQLRTLLGERLDDPSFIYYTINECYHALNIAQRLFAFLTLCLEKTATFNLTNGQAFYTISDQITNFICPLRVSHVNSSTRLRSDTIHNLDLRKVTWRATSGNPARYAQQGFDLLAITPQPSSGSHTLSIVYAGMPAEMTLASDIPEIPTENHIDLVDGAAYIARLKEGGQELVNATEWLQRFLDSATRKAKFIRAKSRAQLYDREPFDLESFDRGRFVIKLKRQMEMRKKQERDNNG